MDSDQLTAVQRAARAAYAAGLSTVPPAEDGSKKPIGPWKDFQTTRPSKTQAAQWWGPCTGLGYIAGAVSGGMLNLEFENRATFDAFRTLATQVNLIEPLQRIWDGYADGTPGGGVRLLLRCPGGPEDWRDEVWAKDEIQEVLIESTMFAILAPTNGRVHPSGKPYERLSGGFPTIATVTADEFLALIDLARSFDRSPKRTRADTTARSHSAGDRVGDDFIRRASWPEILEPHGWRRVYEQNGVTHWRRPGKAIGTSATTNHADSDLFYCFSSSTIFDQERGYNKFAVYTILDHGGDFVAAARGLAAKGYGSRESTKPAATAPAPTISPVITIGAQGLTEAAHAERFAQTYGDRFRFDPRRNLWLEWDGSRWREDATGRRTRCAIELARQLYQAGADDPNPDQQGKIAKWAIGAQGAFRIENTLKLARHLPPIALRGDEWDRDPWLLNAPNGVLDLRTFNIRRGRPEDLLLLSTGVKYDPAAKCPRWERFLLEVFNEDTEVVEYVHKAIGYSLTGITSEQCWFMGRGAGSNGKGTLLSVLKHTLGDYAHVMPFSALLVAQQSAIPNDLAALVGRRFVIAQETTEGRRFDEARLKALTGSDDISARFMRAEWFTFRPCLKLWLAVNHRPVVHDDSFAFWRRAREIPFTRIFPLNQDLQDDLLAEAEGILAWAVEGCRLWQQERLTRVPASISTATADYQAESDQLNDFLEEACEKTPDSEIGARDLFIHYKGWAESHELSDRERLTMTLFGRKVGERFPSKHTRTGKVYLGLARRPSPPPAAEV